MFIKRASSLASLFPKAKKSILLAPLALVDWLISKDCTHVAMESTDVYWKPIYNLLELAEIETLVINAQHIKTVPGRKTDVKDAGWIAGLLQHGLLKKHHIVL